MNLWNLAGCGVAAFALATHAQAQIPDSIPSIRADSLSGLYGGPAVGYYHLLNLQDQLGGRPVLSLTAYATGTLRALYPVDNTTFEYGSGWFDRNPVEGAASFAGAAADLQLRGQLNVTAPRVPLVERELRFRSGDVTLTGVLVFPPGPGPHPAMLMIPGSGPLTRRSPRQVGDLVAAHGVAVLAVDKRGTGGSTGDWNALAHDAWLADAKAAFEALLSEPGIDRERVGIYAASEGGFVGPALAAQRDDVAFLVCRVCSALPHAEAIMDDAERRLLAAGRSAEVAAEAREWLRLRTRYALDRKDFGTLAAFETRTADAEWREDFPAGTRQLPDPASPYWDTYAGVLRGNPAQAYAELDMPVLVVLGGDDQRILAERNAPVFEGIAAGKKNFTVWVLPGASHGLLTDGGYPPGFHQELVDWIVARAVPGG